MRRSWRGSGCPELRYSCHWELPSIVWMLLVELNLQVILALGLKNGIVHSYCAKWYCAGERRINGMVLRIMRLGFTWHNFTNPCSRIFLNRLYATDGTAGHRSCLPASAATRDFCQEITSWAVPIRLMWVGPHPADNLTFIVHLLYIASRFWPLTTEQMSDHTVYPFRSLSIVRAQAV